MYQKKPGYGSRCRDFAELFLGDDIIAHNHGDRIDELASLIQTTVEDWLNANPPKVITPRILVDVPRGKFTGNPVGAPMDDATHFMECAVCGGWIDCRDLGQVLDHERPLPHPSQDKAQ